MVLLESKSVYFGFACEIFGCIGNYGEKETPCAYSREDLICSYQFPDMQRKLGGNRCRPWRGPLSWL